MPPAIAAAGIAAAGAVGSAAIASSSAKKAAKAQQTATAQQIAASERNRDYQYDLNAPTIAAGNAANDRMAGLLKVGGDPAASAAALEGFRGSTGYKDLLDTGLSAVSANAYAKGMGNSGAALKALQDRGTAIADRSMQGYLGNLGTLANFGANARGLVAQVGNNSVTAVNQATQSGADATGAAALIGGSAWSNALKGLVQAGVSATGANLGSSFGGGAAAGGLSAGGIGSVLGGSSLGGGGILGPTGGVGLPGYGGGTYYPGYGWVR